MDVGAPKRGLDQFDHVVARTETSLQGPDLGFRQQRAPDIGQRKVEAGSKKMENLVIVDQAPIGLVNLPPDQNKRSGARQARDQEKIQRFTAWKEPSFQSPHAGGPVVLKWNSASEVRPSTAACARGSGAGSSTSTSASRRCSAIAAISISGHANQCRRSPATVPARPAYARPPPAARRERARLHKARC